MIYEYKCGPCGAIQEVWQKMSDPAPESCAHCQAKGSLERVISATSFALKGSGWYTTDYKRAGTTNNEKKESSASVAECAKPSSGTEPVAPKVEA